MIEAQMETKKVKAIAEAKMKVIKEFNASPDFEVEIAEGSIVAYGYGFKACRA